MNFKYLKTEQCSACSTNIVVRESLKHSNSKIDQHVNGGRRETREFICGFTVEYSPNFGQDIIISDCTQNSEYRLREEKRDKLKQALYSLIHDFDVDQEFKGRLDSSIKYA